VGYSIGDFEDWRKRNPDEYAAVFWYSEGPVRAAVDEWCETCDPEYNPWVLKYRQFSEAGKKQFVRDFLDYLQGGESMPHWDDLRDWMGYFEDSVNWSDYSTYLSWLEEDDSSVD